MRGNVIAIIALVFFVIGAGATGYWAYNTYLAVERREGGDGLRAQLDKLTETRKKREAELGKLQLEMAAMREKYQANYEERLRENVNLTIATTISDAQKSITTVSSDWKAAVEKTPNVSADMVQPLEKEITDRINAARTLNDQQRDTIIERIKKLAEETDKVKKEAAKVIGRLGGEKVRLNNEISAASGEIERMISREPLSNGGMPPAGRILAAAADTRLAVINLGTRVGVKRGMRFEVFQVRYGNRRVHKGFLEVKSTEPEVSTCSILVKEIRLPRCPICNYTAEQSEELYCPRCTAPGSPQAFQRLSGTPKVATVGQSETDPIVKDDLLYNPLFALRPGVRYAVVGEPLQAPVPRPPDDRVTPALLDHIRKTVEFYGGKVVAEVNAETDVVIALRGAKEAVSRAEEMGIPVVREFEIFRYLEK
ncbi:MAG TPA: hypothetical protein PK280_15290 [Planctomycetota bacterium]|nr:hypothetical protein [Planctomycetota bacterium]